MADKLLTADVIDDTLGASAATRAPALERGIALLQVLASSQRDRSLAELSDAIGVSRSTVYSLLMTLQRARLVQKDPRHKTYRLGIGLFELGSAYLHGVSLIPLFNDVAASLVERCRETVKLAVLDGREVVYLAKQEGLYSVRLVARIGSRMAAHATAVGKVLLMPLSDDAIAALYAGYEFPRRTAQTVGALDALLSEVRAARQHGYALDREEANDGVQCVAAPIYDHSSALIAAMSVGVPNDRLDAARMEQLREQVIAHARLVSQRLGYA